MYGAWKSKEKYDSSMNQLARYVKRLHETDAEERRQLKGEMSQDEINKLIEEASNGTD